MGNWAPSSTFQRSIGGKEEAPISEERLESLLSNLSVRYDSQLYVLAREKVAEAADDGGDVEKHEMVALLEVYRVGEGSALTVQPYANWDGQRLRILGDGGIWQRRRDLKGLSFRCVWVCDWVRFTIIVVQ